MPNLKQFCRKIIHKILKKFEKTLDFDYLLLYNENTKIKKGWKLEMKVIVKLLLKFMIKVLLPLGIFAAVVEGLSALVDGMAE